MGITLDGVGRYDDAVSSALWTNSSTVNPSLILISSAHGQTEWKARKDGRRPSIELTTSVRLRSSVNLVHPTSPRLTPPHPTLKSCGEPRSASCDGIHSPNSRGLVGFHEETVKS